MPHSYVSTVTSFSTLDRLRRFFHARDYKEVVTPVTQNATPQSMHIAPVHLQYTTPSHLNQEESFFLRPSPEHHLKRQLAKKSEKIFEIGACFRGAESGRWHKPEFTMLEWYRPHVSLEGFYEETLGMLQHALCQTIFVRKISYRDLFLRQFDFDPLKQPQFALARAADYGLKLSHASLNQAKSSTSRQHQYPNPKQHNAEIQESLDFLLTIAVAELCDLQAQDNALPFISVWHWPSSTAILEEVATVDGDDVVLRFEIYCAGMELVNGCMELRNSADFRQRMTQHINSRMTYDDSASNPDNLAVSSLHKVDLDLAIALDSLPPMCGAAMGMDRLQLIIDDKVETGFSIEKPI